MGEPAPPADFLTLEAAAARHGALRWAERRLYGLTGARSATASLSPAVRVHLFEAATRHAWHAQLWEARLPVLAGWDPEELTVPGDPVAGTLLDAVAGLEGDAAVLAGLYQVAVPALLASYLRHRDALDEASGRPAQRVLGVVIPGTGAELAAGTALLGVLAAPEAETAQRTVAALASLTGHGAAVEPLFPW